MPQQLQPITAVLSLINPAIRAAMSAGAVAGDLCRKEMTSK